MNYLLIRLPFPIPFPLLKLLINTTIASHTDMLTNSLSTLSIQKLMLRMITSGCTMRKLSVPAALKILDMPIVSVMRIKQRSHMSITMRWMPPTTNHQLIQCLPMTHSDRFHRSSDTRSKCPMEHTQLIPYTTVINTVKSRPRRLKLSSLPQLNNNSSQCKSILSLPMVVSLSNSTHNLCLSSNSNTVPSHRLHQ